jgi:hypothetical protein
VAQQLHCAFRSSANHNVVVAHHVLLLTLLADNRDPTTRTGGRYTIIPTLVPLLSVIVGRYCQFIKAVDKILSIALYLEIFCKASL